MLLNRSRIRSADLVLLSRRIGELKSVMKRARYTVIFYEIDRNLFTPETRPWFIGVLGALALPFDVYEL